MLILAVLYAVLYFALPFFVALNLLPNNPIKPLQWLTSDPERSEESVSGLKIDVYTPKSNPTFQKQVIILLHGANQLGKDDPRLTNFAQSLARTGNQVIAPTIPDLTREKFTPVATEQIKTVLAWTKNEFPDSDLALMSFSVASAPMLNALDESIETETIVIMGGYFEMKQLLKFLTTGEYHYQNEIYHEEPDAFGRDLIKEQLAKQINDPAFVRLLDNEDPRQFDALYERLSTQTKDFIDSLSTTDEQLGKINAQEFILTHSNPDPVVPYTHSMQIKDVLGYKAELIILNSFAHVNVQLPKFNWNTLWEFYWPEFKKIYYVLYKFIY